MGLSDANIALIIVMGLLGAFIFWKDMFPRGDK
jgi:hypothetical protein